MKNNWKLIFAVILILLPFVFLAKKVFCLGMEFGLLTNILFALGFFFAFLLGRVLLCFWKFDRDAKDVSEYVKKIKLEHEKRNEKK
jgi:hypothetical protein